MADIVRVQYVGVTDLGESATGEVTFPSPVTAGNLLVIAVSIYVNLGTGHDFVVSDNQGNTWEELVDTNYDGNDVGGMAFVRNCNGGSTTITVTPGASSWYTICAVEISGIDPDDPLDQYNSNDSSGSTWDSGNITTTENDTYLFGFLALDNGNRTLTEDGAFTLIYEVQNGNQYMPISVGERIVSSTLTESYSGAISASSQYLAGIAAFKAAAGGTTHEDSLSLAKAIKKASEGISSR